jgi:hypothetical protein
LSKDFKNVALENYVTIGNKGALSAYDIVPEQISRRMFISAPCAPPAVADSQLQEGLAVPGGLVVA